MMAMLDLIDDGGEFAAVLRQAGAEDPAILLASRHRPSSQRSNSL